MGLRITTLTENTATLNERTVGLVNCLAEWGLSHCTGLPAASFLTHEFGDVFFFNNTGTVTEL